MTERTIAATRTELQTLGRRIADAERCVLAAQLAKQAADDAWTMFCEGHGVSEATFVAFRDGQVIVSLPDAPKEPAP